MARPLPVLRSRTKKCWLCKGRGHVEEPLPARLKRGGWVYVACTGAGPSTGKWGHWIGILSPVASKQAHLWQCTHGHQKPKFAFACARKEARRRGWVLMERTKNGWRKERAGE